MAGDGADEVVGPGGGEGNVSGATAVDSANGVGSAASIEVCSVHFGYCVGPSCEVEYKNITNGEGLARSPSRVSIRRRRDSPTSATTNDVSCS